MSRAEGLLVGALLWTGCAAAAPGPELHERCLLRVWYRPDKALARDDLKLTRAQAERPEVLGSWNGFARPGLRQFERRRGADGIEWWTLALPLPPGRHSFAVLVGDVLLPDDREPQSEFGRNPLYLDSGPYEAEFSTVELPDCALPTLTLEDLPPAVATPAGTAALQLRARFVPGTSGEPLDAAAVKIELRRGPQPLPPPTVKAIPDEAGGHRIEAVTTALPPGKYTLTLRVQDRLGHTPPTVTASSFISPASDVPLQPTATLEDAVVYHLLVDRFRGPAGALSPPPTPGMRAGGTLAGVRAAVEAGYFERLGVTTLWLSPLYQNPTGFFVGRDGQRYQAYHGYWPSEPRTVEPQLGGEAQLEALVAAAHRRGLRLILDAVPNHVFEAHPYAVAHSRRAKEVAGSGDPARASWFNDGPSACVCGSPGCGWGERIEDCWFDRYLPDLNWRNPAVADAGVADLLWWIERFDLDGLRIDAVPMMPRSATRRIVRGVHAATWRGGIDGLIVGETYTGPGDGGRAEIRSFLGARFDGLDSAFDFPLMWAIRSALGSDHSSLVALEDELVRSARAWSGSGAVMAHIFGNHDTPRFLSEAAGDAGNDPWRTPSGQPVEVGPYRRLALALTLVLTLPGLPVLYYGDEVGLAGAGDPDSRRVLPDVLDEAGGLRPEQREVLSVARRLGQLRACLPALRRGTRTPLSTDLDTTVALHRPAATPTSDAATGAGAAIVVLSRAAVDKRPFLRDLPRGRYRDVLSGEPLEVTGDSTAIIARSERPAVYVDDTSPCARLAR